MTDQPQGPPPFLPEDQEAAEQAETINALEAQVQHLTGRAVTLNAYARALSRDLDETRRRLAALEADRGQPDDDAPQDATEGPWGPEGGTVDPMPTDEPHAPEAAP